MIRRSLLAGLAALLPASAALAFAPVTTPQKLVPRNPLGLRGPLKIGLRQIDHGVIIDVMIQRQSTRHQPVFSYVLFRNGHPLYRGFVQESGGSVVYRGSTGGQFYAELSDPLGNLVARSSMVEILSETEESD